MKKIYSGLNTRRIIVECQPFMQTMSVQKIKAKTKVQDWHEEAVDVEIGIGKIGDTDIDEMTISNTPIP